MTDNRNTIVGFSHSVGVDHVLGKAGEVSLPRLDVLPSSDQRGFVEHLQHVASAISSPSAETSARLMQSMKEMAVAIGGKWRSDITAGYGRSDLECRCGRSVRRPLGIGLVRVGRVLRESNGDRLTEVLRSLGRISHSEQRAADLGLRRRPLHVVGNDVVAIPPDASPDDSALGKTVPATTCQVAASPSEPVEAIDGHHIPLAEVEQKPDLIIQGLERPSDQRTRSRASDSDTTGSGSSPTNTSTPGLGTGHEPSYGGGVGGS